MKQSWPISVLRNLLKETGEDYENGRSKESVLLIKTEPDTFSAQTNTPPRPVIQQSLDMRVIFLRVLSHTSCFASLRLSSVLESSRMRRP
jgi:hypothetical protein